MESLSPERWQRLEELLDAIFDLPPEERAAFLDRACADDPALRVEVEAMLKADARAGTFLQKPVGAVAATLLREAHALSIDGADTKEERIGPYRLLHEIGRGGMGMVYLAERADGQFDQRVALKLIRPGLISATIHQRFLHERQILARLQHPHIARLYDGGVTDPGSAPGSTGQPYFAMEYVEGTPLTTYCDHHRLSVEDRLRLFEQVGQAVQYAHRNLVVHRDLKPSNILVTKAGRVKLLDFGIAKVLGEGEVIDEALPLTQTGLRVMTPEYAAPEQVRGEPVSTATDIYALGVILYEMLTGHRPYRIDRRRTGAVEQAVLEQEPERPSTAVNRIETYQRTDGSTATLSPETVSRARNTQADKLRRRLSGDLDTVLLKALRKEPERRYASAEAFVEDLRHYLVGLPVKAQSDTVRYRASKFMRRHRWAVLAVALVVVALVGGLTVALWQARVAGVERDRARVEAQKAAQVSGFLVDLFNVSNPLSTGAVRGDTLTARTLLARGAARLEGDLAEQPVVQAELQSTIGEVYKNLNMFAEADTFIQAALARKKQIFGEQHEAVAASLSHLGQLRQEQGEYTAAEELHRAALAMRQAVLAAPHEAIAESQYFLGVALTWQQKDMDEGEAVLRQALATRREVLGDESLDVAYALNSLGNVLVDLKRYEEAERYLQEALALRRKLVGSDHPTIAVSINNLALALRNQERYADAEPLYREAVTILRKHLGEAHLYIAIGLNNLADVLGEQGKHPEAEALYRDGLAVFDALDLHGHALEAVIRSRWGASLVALGRYAEAEPELLAGYSQIRDAFGAKHSFTGKARDRVVALYEAWGQPEQAAAFRTVDP